LLTVYLGQNIQIYKKEYVAMQYDLVY